MKKHGNDITPNNYAKELILEKIDELLEGCWEEELWNYKYPGGEWCLDGITDKELEKVKELLIKRIKGVYNYLGYTRHDL